MGKYFGTDGFRGEANVTLTVEHAYKVGRFLGWYFGKDKQDQKAHIVIGKDTRLSSYMFEYSLVAGLVASGADAYLLHVTTTPSVSYIARVDEFDCGIMISASHNPYYDNGIKLINSDGEKMSQDVIDQIEKYLDGEIEIPSVRQLTMEMVETVTWDILSALLNIHSRDSRLVLMRQTVVHGHLQRQYLMHLAHIHM